MFGNLLLKESVLEMTTDSNALITDIKFPCAVELIEHYFSPSKMLESEKLELSNLFACMGTFKMTPAVMEQMCIESDCISGPDGFLSSLRKRIRLERLAARLNSLKAA